MKPLHIPLLLTLLLILLSTGCRSSTDMPRETVEDLQRLFPFKGPEKPEVRYEEMPAIPGDPEVTPETFHYPGVEIPGEGREYEVTLTCSYRETNFGRPVPNPSSVYYIRYIAADKSLSTIASKQIEGVAVDHLLTNMKPFTLKFKARSGFPIFVAVTGSGPRASTVAAQISAVSTDGLLRSPVLSTELTQNHDGMDRLDAPYCKYIILP